MDATQTYINQQFTMAVIRGLMLGLGDAAPKLDHQCVIVPASEQGALPEPQKAAPDYAEIERAKLRRKLHICECAPVGMCAPKRQTLTGNKP